MYLIWNVFIEYNLIIFIWRIDSIQIVFWKIKKCLQITTEWGGKMITF